MCPREHTSNYFVWNRASIAALSNFAKSFTFFAYFGNYSVLFETLLMRCLSTVVNFVRCEYTSFLKKSESECLVLSSLQCSLCTISLFLPPSWKYL